MSRQQQARAQAAAAHAAVGQRYGDEPYVAHLDAVHAAAIEFGITDEDILVATYLHDIIEDTPVTRADVERDYGPRVAELVEAVTDPPGHDTRRARKAAVYPDIRAVHGATRLKLADRIANVRASLAGNPRLLAKYREEHPGFRAALRQPDAGLDPVELRMWDALDALIAGD